MKAEQLLAIKVSSYLQHQYPATIFNFNIAADLRLSIGQAKRNSNLQGRWSRGYPDLILLEARDGYGALFIELKVKSPYKKNGELLKSDHLECQDNFHKMLRVRGYRAEFAYSFEGVKSLIDGYLAHGIGKGDKDGCNGCEVSQKGNKIT